ncbi:MAG: diacylglycerol kinase family lipid kinase [Chloroflexota bacterium]|nr:diacylglycerol kinase family lipid kinase [Chloroflexota bacterium]
MKSKLIVNPMSARGTMQKRWHEIEATLRAENLEYDFALTERRGHATELARAALAAGYELIVAVGGDGTLNEVVNGMLDADSKAINPSAALGVISSGTGSDFVRTAGLPREMIAAARHLAHATASRPLDIGEMTFRHAEGKEARRYFANVAGMGFDAEVIERLERSGKRGGGTIPYYSALLTTISRYRNKDVTLQVDDRHMQGKMNSVVICNGKYFGGGMMVGPNATLDDGQFDVIILGDFGTLEVVLNTPRLYNGTILNHPKVSEYRGQTVTVEAKQRMLIEADGELIGEGPATFRVLPGALKLRG